MNVNEKLLTRLWWFIVIQWREFINAYIFVTERTCISFLSAKKTFGRSQTVDQYDAWG